MAGFTNRGKKLIIGCYFGAQDVPVSFTLALLTSSAAITVDTENWSDTDISTNEIAPGNGYTTKGEDITRSIAVGGFKTPVEDDGNDYGYIRAEDVIFTASGGSLPASGDGARYAVLLDDDSDPNVIAWVDFTTDRSVGTGESILVQDLELRGEE